MIRPVPVWMRRGLAGLRRWLWPLRAREVEDLPDRLSSDHIYLIGEDGLWWSAALLCPCGCQSVIQLSLIEDDRPRWRARTEPGDIVTLHPSVWRTNGCKSHFFVRHGKIRWARATSESP